MKSAVVVFPGINRERDMARALRLVSGREPAMVWHADAALPSGTDLVVIPGGFSYGDYLRCGAIAARAPIMDAVRAFAGKGGLVLAVCNGFQIACEAGLLPGVLMRNAQLRFICHDVYLRVERSDTMPARSYAFRWRTARVITSRTARPSRGSKARAGWPSATLRRTAWSIRTGTITAP